MLTGNKDVDFLILNRLSDYELTRVCEVNTKARIYCNNEEYWKLRTYQRFNQYISPLNPKDFVIDTWKNYYINMAKNIQDFNKDYIIVSDFDNSIYKAIPKGLLPGMPSLYEVTDDLKNVLIKLEEKRTQYKTAIYNIELKKINELIHDELIDVNYFISRMDGSNAKVLIFLYRQGEKFLNVNKKLIEEKLLEIAQNVVSAYIKQQVDIDYVEKLGVLYPEIGKLVQGIVKEIMPPKI